MSELKIDLIGCRPVHHRDEEAVSTNDVKERPKCHHEPQHILKTMTLAIVSSGI